MQFELIYEDKFAVYVIRMPLGSTTKGAESETEAAKPVYVGEFPQVVRDAQQMLLHSRVSG